MPELEPLILLEDEPVPDHETDELSLMPFSKVVAGTAIGTNGPFTIGVFADWGQGKTSVLKQAKSLIESSYPNVVTVWFNPWKYEKEEHLIIPLIATILQAVKNKESKLKGTAKIWFKSVGNALRSVGYGLSMKANVKIPLVGEVGVDANLKDMIDREEELKKAQKSGWEQSLYYTAFQALDELAYPEEEANENQLPKLVLFIDDLDRCFPPQAVKLLESIKLVLAQKGFIFVLAVDRNVIDSFLTKRYKEEFGIADYGEGGKSYLDKIIQLPLGLPPHKTRFDNYIRDLLKRPELCHKSNQEIKQALSGLTEVLAIGSNYNPRNLVRFINNLIVDRSIRKLLPEPLPVDQESLGMCAIARILSQHLGEALFRQLVRARKLCEALASGPEIGKSVSIESLRIDLVDETGEPRSRAERLDLEIIRRLEDAEFLQELLRTDAGKLWLTDRDARIEVDSFYRAQREAVEKDVPASQTEIVEHAIREILGKNPGQRISDEDRASTEELYLTDTAITDAGLELLPALTNLRRLLIDDTSVTDAGLAHLAKLTNLQTLSLMATQVTDVGFVHIASLTSLQILWIGGTQVTDMGLAHIAALSNLQRLSLTNTKITDEGVEHLSGLINLQMLSLNDTQITDAGVEHLNGLVNLQRLWLSNTKITNEGLEHLSGLVKLKVLDLGHTQITDAAIAKLRKALPKCSISR